MKKLFLLTICFGVTTTVHSHAFAQSNDLFIWAKQPEAQLINYMRRSGDSVHAIDKDNARTLLHYAAMCTTSATSIPYLLKKGLDPHAKDQFGSTPMMYAVEESCSQGIRELSQAGAKLNVKNIYDETTLHTWADNGYGNTYIGEWIIGNGVEINAKTFNGATALLLATTNFDDKKVKWLLEKGADPNIKDNQGVTPLSFLQTEYITKHLETRKKRYRKRAAKIAELLKSKTTVKGQEFVFGSAPTKGSLFAEKIAANKLKANEAAKKNQPMTAAERRNFKCPVTQFKNLTGEEGIAMKYAVKQDIESKGVDYAKYCIEKITAKSKVPFRRNTLVQYRVDLLYPFGYKTNCLKIDSEKTINNLSKQWDWDAFEQVTAGGCNAFDDAIGGKPIEVGGKRYFESETQI